MTDNTSAPRKSRQTTPRSRKLRRIASTGMLAAVAFALMFVEFPIPMLIPPFIKFDFSDLPALLGAFAFGPWTGVLIELLKNLLHIALKGTSSAFVGELCNFLLGSVMCLVAGLLYKRKKTKKSAVLGSLIGCLAMALASVPLNYFLVYPAYEVAFHLPMENIVAMYSAILPAADNLLKCLVIFNLPFTFVKGLADAVICILIYKPLSPFLKGKNQ
ncbi:MAG: ECF transporter S component [Clostridia bacterium]|nr:ECF transporter S component [Clostridia bacterium]